MIIKGSTTKHLSSVRDFLLISLSIYTLILYMVYTLIIYARL